MSFKISKNRTQPIKIFVKDKIKNTEDFTLTKIKTVAELLNIEKNRNANDDYFLQSYKQEDINFMKNKLNNDNSTTKGNCNV